MRQDNKMNLFKILKRFNEKEFPNNHIIEFIPDNQAERILMRSLTWLDLWYESSSIYPPGAFYLKTREAIDIWEQINSKEEE